MSRKVKKRVRCLAMYIALILVTILTLFPLFWGVSASLRENSELFSNVKPFSLHTLIPIKFTLKSYIELFTVHEFYRPVLNTIWVTGVSILLGCILNSIAAFSFAVFDFKFKKPLFGLVLLSFMIPFEAIALPLYQVADSMNLVNTYRGMILPSIANGLVLFLFIQFFRDIPADILDAARIDGANTGKIYMKVLMPLSKPIFITAGLMIFMDQWNSYLWPLLIARSREIGTIQIALTQFNTEHGTDWSSMYAGAMFSALIPLLLFLPLQKYFVQGITSSGVKG